jgi:hypothetical protein
MRKLLYVPIIHMESDLGSIAPMVDNTSASLCGEERWTKHKETVAEFWERVKEFFDRLDSTELKIYQDGLPEDGELGRRIIREAAKRGSKNHQIILDLIKKGAEIRKTEDVSLLKEEYERIIKLAQAKSRAQRILAYAGYELHKGRLIAERDRFIARTINETLSEGETGILFIGTYHDVLPHLATDIAVKQLKEQEKLRAYFKGLISEKDEEKLQQLAEYLVSPI